MTLPIRPPLEPMLARSEEEIPKGDGWRYEPKWDGFRAIAFRDGAHMTIGSRGGKTLERYFPELVAALAEALPRRCVVDGEIVVAWDGVLDFEVLQQRIHPADSRVRKLAKETPSSYVAFDLLAEGSRDLRAEPLFRRWDRLTRILEPKPTGRTMRAILAPHTRVVLTPQTTHALEATRWFDELEEAGLDGVIAKRDDLTYQPGKRVMVKVKHQRTIDCVVGGYRIHKSGRGVGSLLLGLYDENGILHQVGASGAFSMADRLAMLDMLRPLEGGQAFEGGATLGGPSRWRAQEKDWIPVEPALVCEVAYDHFQGGRRFRHLAQFLRWRPDRKPRSCTFDQVSERRG
ncbi:MAG TPA: ATP-dependent DNA ligase [Actinomycetota bacterium]|jgi:ATP-dependent DNA ligase|nr:ATP-dependent DNA ligase [Actinomycetota bacterium]